MTSRALAALVAPLALASAACDSARAPPCPGDRIATFRFASGPALDGGCPFAPDGGISFTATLTLDADSTARLCVDRPQAEPLQGVTYDGGHVVVSSKQPAAASAPGCACDLEVSETLEGDVQSSDGVALAFSGTLRDRVAPAAGVSAAGCEPDGGAGRDAGCGVPCDLQWVVTGVP